MTTTKTAASMLRQLIGKASFSSSSDKHSALQWLEALEAAAPASEAAPAADPLGWIDADTLRAMQATPASDKTRWPLYNLGTFASKDGMVPVYAAAPAAQAVEPPQHQGMTIAGNGASELGQLMRKQWEARGGLYPDGNPNAGQP